MEENAPAVEPSSSNQPKIGRTWADLVVGSTYIMGGLLFIALVIFVSWYFVGEVPQWIIIAIIGSLAFLPFLIERAKDDAKLFIVLDGPMRMTEWRIGRRVNLEVEGNPISFKSSSGVERSILVEFDEDEKTGKGSDLANFSQFDQIRDLNTVHRMSQTLQETLKEDRVTMMHVGIEVERRSREIVDWALRVIYEGSVPTEISAALGLEEVPEPEVSYQDDVEAMLDA